jgi:hypothetical protein
VRVPGVTDTHPRDASIPVEPECLHLPCSVTSNCRVHHDCRTSCFICISHVAHIVHVVHDVHNDRDYPNEIVRDCNGYNEV